MADEPRIPFNRPFATGREFDLIREAIENMHLSGNGPFSGRCADWPRASHCSSLSTTCTGLTTVRSISWTRCSKATSW